MKTYKKLLSATGEQWKAVHKLLVDNGIFFPWDEYNPVDHVLSNDKLRISLTKKINFDELVDNVSENAKIILLSKLLNHMGLSCVENEGNWYFVYSENITEAQSALISKFVEKTAVKTSN